MTALFLPICITRTFPWEQPNPQRIPHALISTVYNISHGMWSLQNKESWQPQKEKAASTRACRAEPGAQFPITSHRHKPLLPPSHQCTSGTCLHTAEKTISSILSALDTQQWKQSSPELTDGQNPCRVFWYLLWSSGSSVHCWFRSWQACPWSPMTPSNFTQQPQQLGTEQSRCQPPSDRGQAVFTCSSDHHWTS